MWLNLLNSPLAQTVFFFFFWEFELWGSVVAKKLGSQLKIKSRQLKEGVKRWKFFYQVIASQKFRWRLPLFRPMLSDNTSEVLLYLPLKGILEFFLVGRGAFIYYNFFGGWILEFFFWGGGLFYYNFLGGGAWRLAINGNFALKLMLWFKFVFGFNFFIIQVDCFHLFHFIKGNSRQSKIIIIITIIIIVNWF